MKRILYVELSSGFGGSSEALYNLLKYINRNNYHPIVLITREGRNFERIKGLGIEVISVPIIYLKHTDKEWLLISYFKSLINLILDVFINSIVILNILHKKKIDLVHLNTILNNNFQSIIAAKIGRTPCICHVRETRKLHRIEKIFRKYLDRIIVLNQDAYKCLSENFDSNKVMLIPDGQDLEIRINENDVRTIKNQFALDGYYCVGILGRLVDGKGHQDFIKAASLIIPKHKNVKFLIIGNDPDKNYTFEKKLRSLVAELHVDENIIFTGWRNDKNEMISVLDIVVQASSTFPEGFGLTCIEAMALKKPVVATNISGPNAIVENGITGFLVPAANPQELSLALMKIIKSPSLAISFGAAGRNRVEKHFDIKIVVSRIENLYSNI